MNASRRLRTGGAFGHLLLVVVLALGVFVMHTVGHPDDPAMGGTNMSSSPSSAQSTGMGSVSHEVAMGATGDHLDQTQADHAQARTDHAASPHTPAMAMDMQSLCMAVLLGAWVLAALLRAALARHPDWLAELLVRIPVALRPNPPPRGPDLTRLSVLRL